MTAALEPALAAAYVHELSAAVAAVVVLDRDGALLAGPEALAGPAAGLARLIEDGVLRVDGGTVWVATGPGRTVIAIASPWAHPGGTALDVAAAAGAEKAPEAVANPSAELKIAVSALSRAV